MIQRLVLRLLFVPTLLVGLVGAGLLSAQSEPVHAIDPAGIETLRRQTDGQVRIGVHRATGAVRFLGLRPGSIAVQGNSPRERAADFFRSHGSLFGISNIDAQLSEPTLRTDPYGFTHLTYRQTHRNLPVFAGVIKVHADGLGRMTAVNGTFVPGIDIDTHPTWSARAAASVALAHVRGALELDRDVRIKPVADRLLVFRSGLVQQVDGTDHLAYEIEVEGTSVREFVYIDAHTGKVIDRYTGIHDAIERRIHEPDFDDVVIWDEGDTLPYSTGDSGNDDQVNDLIDFASDVYDLYSNLSGGTHLSWDGTDGTMHTVWNASFLGCPNASWNGTSTNYCDGVASDDVVAHEWTHAYTQATHGLIYRWQPGALNESYSDIFGEVVDFINGDGTDSPVSVRTAGDCSSFGGNPPPSLDINAPVSLAGGIPAAGAAFNPTPPVSVTADVELVNDGDDNNGNGSVTDGCEPLIGFTPGRIALIDRGTCSFVSKVNAAEAAGAVGVIVVNNQSGVFNMSGNDGGNVTPVLLIDIADGASIKVELGGGQTVNVTLALNSASASSYRWLVGEDSSGFGGSIRDMWNPVCFSDPGKISDVQYVCSSGDSGGVHSNSGVPNHLFALLVDGGTYNGQTITPIGLTKAAHLYWRAMSVYQVESSGFGDHADSLNQSCNDLLGIPLADLSTGAPSGLKINAGDCTQVLNGGLATEMQLEPDCDFQPLLTQSPPALTCPSIAFFDDFEGDPESVWTRTNAGVFAEYTPRDWALTADLPPGGTGSAFFAIDDIDLGNCIEGDGDESGLMQLDSPPIFLTGSPTLSFEHYVATEGPFDGGNVKISVDGAPFEIVPNANFTFNPYNDVLDSGTNTNPMAGEEAFTGSDGGLVTGSWGQSQVDLSSFAVTGNTIRLRFEFGVDGCNGLDGWYLDDVTLCSSTPAAGSVPDGNGVPGVPLLVNKGGGGDLVLTWGSSCNGSDTDFGVYEGTVGDFTSHLPVVCTTSGLTSETLTPGPDDAYYLVVPKNDDAEGSYGRDGNGLERPQGAGICELQVLAPSCP